MHQVTILLMRHAIPSLRPPPKALRHRALYLPNRRGTHQASWHKTTVKRQSAPPGTLADQRLPRDRDVSPAAMAAEQP